MVRLAKLIAALVLAAVVVLAPPAWSQQGDDADALNAQVIKLCGEGKYAEATPLAQRSLAIREKAFGPDHTSVGTTLNSLAELYRKQGRYADAEPLYKRALAIHEKALGPDHPEVGTTLNNLAGLYRAQGHYTDAEPLYKRALGIDERALGNDHADVGRDLNNLGLLYQTQGRYADAELLYKRSLVITEKALGPNHPEVAIMLNNLAMLHDGQGRYADAEPLFKRSLVISEKALGPDHPEVANTLNNFAALYYRQGRYADAVLFYERALTIREKALGADHPSVGTTLSNLAEAYRQQGRQADAEPLYKRALSIREKALGPDHPEVAATLNNLAELYRKQGRYADAEALYKRIVSVLEKALGPDHPSVGTALNNSALLHRRQARYADADSLYKRALSIRKKALGPDHAEVATTLNNLAFLYLVQQQWTEAASYWRQSTDLMIRRSRRDAHTVGQGLAGKIKSDAERQSNRFLGLVKAAYRLAAPEADPTRSLASEMFQTAQWALGSEAAASLAQMAARGAKGDDDLARIVRKRQDFVGEWQAKDKLLIAARSAPPDRRNGDAEKALGARLAAIDAQLAEIDKTLAKDFPDYSALASPEPLGIPDVQAQLSESEALVLFLDTPQWQPTPEETFIWAVTKTHSRWVKTDIGTDALRESVTSLRCGLDESAWSGEGGAHCAALLGLDPATGWQRGDPLPFNLGKSYDLYAKLFGGVEDLIQDKHLLLVPSGPLTSLPFQVLTTEAPKNAPYAKASWLIRKHALTVLPSVASLAALRRNAHLSAAPEPFIGYGNPVLTGEPGCGEIVIPDRCPQEELQVAAAPTHEARSAKAMEDLPSFFRNGLANVAAVSKLCPLPDTAHELTCVAKSLGAPPSSVVLGRDMTETALKMAPLNRYRVLHFATHGLLAGETGQLAMSRAEPALVMSPPQAPTKEDDGLLTASEVAALKLDADWVVMSACNTAGGGELGAEALSGLARAFFYAGTRALLVSHWPVNSYAATMLTSRTFAEMRKEKDIGRSEAFRRAMLALMSDAPWAAHPSVWAPFVVVGEGGAPGKVEAVTNVQPPSAAASAAVPVISPATPEIAVEPLAESKRAEPAQAPARKKVKRKPKSEDDWITNLFGQ